MLSIFVMYSTDRREALNYTISCLEDMELYSSCQKTLVVDNESIDFQFPGWSTVVVPRIDEKFCWARMWDAGVASAQFPQVIYLDCDRLLPKTYLKLVHETVKNDVFAFSSKHFNLLDLIPLETCKRILAGEKGMFLESDVIGLIQYERRLGRPFHGSSKNVMSGCTAFTKETYYRLGGIDPWYCGHGAFADTDFHLAASLGGCEFIDLDLTELHLPHFKLNSKGRAITWNKLWKLSLDNFIYYCLKWNLPLKLAEDMAEDSGFAAEYVHQKESEIFYTLNH